VAALLRRGRRPVVDGLTEIRTGPLWEAVRASSAIPGILPPFFTSEGRMLVDGGCIDNMPFRSMHRLKTGPNVVVNVQKETAKSTMWTTKACRAGRSF
jgi:predicted acylesterase/phospholipase RssA